MRIVTRYTLVLAGWLLCGGLAPAHATTLGEVGATSGTQHALAGSGGLSASKTLKRTKDSLGRSSSSRGTASRGNSGGGNSGAWKATDGWVRNGGSGTRGASGQTWVAGGSWDNRNNR